jgi:hypothetical protein
MANGLPWCHHVVDPIVDTVVSRTGEVVDKMPSCSFGDEGQRGYHGVGQRRWVRCKWTNDPTFRHLVEY